MKKYRIILRIVIITLSILTLTSCGNYNRNEISQEQTRTHQTSDVFLSETTDTPENPESGEQEEHTSAQEPQIIPDQDPVGYCGNTVTKILLDGETYSFWGNDSVALTDMLLHLNYADGLCRCPVEFTVDTEFDDGNGYGVNLESAFVCHGENQCPLTSEQIEEIQGIVDRNCVEPVKLED